MTERMWPSAKNGTRTTCGSHIGEFGAAFVLLIGCIVLPLLNMSVVPLRYGIGKSTINNEVRQLSQLESFSEALQKEKATTSGVTKLSEIGGVVVKSSELTINVESTKNKGHTRSFDKPKSISKEWLPEGAESPCVYLLDLKVNVEIHPLITAPLPVNIPGVSGPIGLQFHETSPWENLARDPVTGEFYINQ